MTSNSKELIELAERCEKATGPDRELDRMISLTSNDRDERARINPPLFTASLDAAKTLYVRVPEHIPSNPLKAAAQALRQRADMA